MAAKTTRFKKLLILFTFLIALGAVYFVLVKPASVFATSSCSDACLSGSKRCSGSGYQLCVKASSGCYVWGSATSCTSGYKCSNGTCVRSCSDACSSGSKRCSGSGYQTCIKASSGCYVWGSTSNCSTGYKCSNGTCVRSCSDACSSGSKRCSGSGYQTCVKASTGCYAWGSTSNCSSGYKCSNGTCVRSCSDACSSGSKRCSGSGYQTCTKQSSGCYAWGSTTNCSTGYKCSNGTCVRSCSDACSSGSKRCSGSGYQTCTKASTGCYAWSSTANCSTGYTCSNGTCVRSCSDACSSGAKRCSGSGYQTCAKQSNGCYGWGSTTNCSTGYECSNGTCVRSCSDACSSGSKRCSGNGVQTCIKQSSGCYGWGSTANCSSGYTCSNGTCVRSCSDECTNGAKQCSGNGYQTCVKQSTGCYAWGSVTNCSSGYICQDAVCVRSCSDECASGEKQCLGDGYQTCVKKSTGCYGWGSAKNCQTGYACQDGSCVKSCVNKCESGEHECSGTSGRVCEYGGECTVWGVYQKCDDRCFYCGDGKCNSDCGESKTSCSEDCGSEKPIVELTGPDSVSCQGTADLTWTSANATSCKAYGAWSGTKDTAGSEIVTLELANKTYSLTCTGLSGSASDSLTVKIDKVKPEADAGSDREVAENERVTLNGSGRSFDNSDSELAYAWTCSGGSLSDSDSAETDFIAPAVSRDTSYTCTLKVKNGCGLSGTDTVSIKVFNRVAGEFGLSLAASPDSGCAPLNKVDLTAKVIDIQDDRDSQYTYYFSCDGGDSWDKTITTSAASYTAKDLCDYDSEGDFTAAAKVEGKDTDATASDTVQISANDCNGGSFAAQLSASPDSGCAPLENVDLTAKVTDIKDHKDSQYTYYFSCDGDDSWDKTVTTGATSYTAKDLCDYDSDSSHTAEVKIVGSETGNSETNSVLIDADNCGSDEFTVSLEAEPDSGCKPLRDVDLTARIDNYDGDGEEFTYYFDCDNSGSWDRTVTTSKLEFTAKDLCDYASGTEKTAKVKVENSDRGRSASDTVRISLDSCNDDSEFDVSLTASPRSGCAPLRNVDLTAHVTGGDDNDDDYTYSFDCGNDGSWDKTITTSATTYTARDLCDYDDSDDYTARVKVENDSQSDNDTLIINVDDCNADAGDLRVEKSVSNLSRGVGYYESVEANPGDYLSFRIKITALDDDISDIELTDILPDGLANARDVRVDGSRSGDDLEDGIDVGDLDEGDESIITFTASVESASNFRYGQTTLTNSATARAKGTSDSDTAQVIVRKQEVEGITTVSTGLTDNPLVDSFVIPLAGALFLIWAFKAKLIAAEEWLDSRRLAFAKFQSQKALSSKIASLKSGRLKDKFT